MVAGRTLAELLEPMSPGSAVHRAPVTVDPPIVPDGAVDVVLTKASVRRLLACSGLQEEPPAASAALMKGRLLDRLVAAHLAGGLPADPWDGLREMLVVDGSSEALETASWIDHLERPEQRDLADDVHRMNEIVVACWGTVDPAWWARTEAPIAWQSGQLTMHGRVDVMLGPPRQRSTLIEVKSGGFWHDHLSDLRFYALIAALRDPEPPGALIWFHPANDSPWMIEPLTSAILESEARRVQGALERIGAARTPGWWCMRCRRRPSCPVAIVQQALPVDHWMDAVGEDDASDD
jgi:hypothetical protein